MNAGLYARRRLMNQLFLVLSTAAALFGIGWLAIILSELLINGFSALSPAIFTEMTPVPGEPGGLANAIFGSIFMSTVAVLIGAPIGILAGTYLAEYGRHSWAAAVMRFINDILLSTPSILTGLFIYEIVVVNTASSPFQKTCSALLGSYCFMGHFSAWAGALALAVIVIPVVVRITENMLRLVPNGLREAAAALGAPRSSVIRTVTWRAARAGMITGILLAISRIAGETAPMIFTSFGNQFWSSNPNAPMASLPKVIFDFANSAYEDLHRLAWAGALIITIAVLTLSILARVLERNRS